ncbi:hypothetical protein F5876DRAFT_67060 [Lentinula aff. lateritia]|uniref:Uncharacterized protein n=1 Tax=Lentinula aff. lateritia TaxID=2804960 RepID=A0ACC1TVU4_9AGAR|nr:hypothetical protein F5876DRAFT_67060 [Lentinula aff. lateritia]
MSSTTSFSSSAFSSMVSVTNSASGTSSTSSIQSGTPSGGNSTDTGSGSDSGGSLANSASLYLYTFLATLVLLLGVSAAIVVRSLVLRRRHRRMVEEAIRNGTYVPPSVIATARGRVDLAMKPKMWEATVRSEWNGKEGGWADILPVSASISSTLNPQSIADNIGDASSDGVNNHNTTLSPAPGTNSMANRLRSAPAASARVALEIWRLISPGSHHPSQSDHNFSASHNAHPLVETKAHQTLPHAEMSVPTHVEVAVMIAMPGALAVAAHRSKEGADEEDLPHVEVGMAEVIIPPNTTATHIFEEGSSSEEQP